jgi:hypothetical protein
MTQSNLDPTAWIVDTGVAYASISEAITASSDYDTILVSEGVFNSETITLKTGMTLVGQSKEGTVLEDSEIRTTDGCIVRNMSLKDGTWITCSSTAHNNLWVDDIVFDGEGDAGATGIYFNPTSGSTLKNIKVTNCHFQNLQYGLRLNAAVGAVEFEIYMENCIFMDAATSSRMIDAGDQTAERTMKLKMKNCVIGGGGVDSGIYIGTGWAGELILEDCKLFEMNNDAIQINRNTVASDITLTFLRNVIIDNTAHAIEIVGTTGSITPHIAGNIIYGNDTGTGDQIDTSLDINMEYNWWGTASPSDALFTGGGTVDYEPYLKQPLPELHNAVKLWGVEVHTNKVWNLTKGTVYETITDAMTAASARDSILISEGHFNENFSASQDGLRIYGSGEGRTIIHRVDGDIIDTNDKNRLHISNMTLNLGQSGSGYGCIQIRNASNDIHIENVTMIADTNLLTNGILIDSDLASSPQNRGIYVDNCTFRHLYYGIHGLMDYDASGNYIKELTVVDSVFQTCQHATWFEADTTGANLNVIQFHGKNLKFVSPLPIDTLGAQAFYFKGNKGIILLEDCIIEGADIVSTGNGNGVAIACENAAGTMHLIMRGCVVRQNKNGIYIDQSTGTVNLDVRCNLIYDNIDYDINVNGGVGDADFEYNWWGTSSPAAGQFNGNVDYTPYLTQPCTPGHNAEFLSTLRGVDSDTLETISDQLDTVTTDIGNLDTEIQSMQDTVVVDLDTHGLVHIPYATTTINDGAGLIQAAVTVTVATTNNFPSTGVLQIENELITYTGKTATTFTGLTRGAYNTSDVAHNDGTTVYHATRHRVKVTLHDSEFNPEAPDSAPTIQIKDQDDNTELSDTAMTQDGALVGVYYYDYTLTNANVQEFWDIRVTVIEGGNTNYFFREVLITDEPSTPSDILTNAEGELYCDEDGYYNSSGTRVLWDDDYDGDITDAETGVAIDDAIITAYRVEAGETVYEIHPPGQTRSKVDGSWMMWLDEGTYTFTVYKSGIINESFNRTLTA